MRLREVGDSFTVCFSKRSELAVHRIELVGEPNKTCVAPKEFRYSRRTDALQSELADHNVVRMVLFRHLTNEAIARVGLGET